MIYGYVRVSTQEQDWQSQMTAIQSKYKIDEWMEEKRSGTVDYKKRDLGDLIYKLKAGDTLIVTELSRLGRSLDMIYRIISELKDRKVRCIAIKNSFDMNPNNPNDIISEVLLFAFGLSAQIERQLISERAKSGIAAARAKGKQIGKKKGEIPYYVKLRPYQVEIVEKRINGGSILGLAREYGVTWKTMQNFLNVRIYQKPPAPLVDCPKKHGHPTYREREYFRTHNA